MNLCQKIPRVCRDNRGVLRKNMPQIESQKPFAELEKSVQDAILNAGGDADAAGTVMDQVLARLNEYGIEFRQRTAPVGWLRATQKEMDAAKVEQMLENYRAGKFAKITDPILVSRDGYIVDGHHRWAALLLEGALEEIGTNVIDLDIDDLLHELRACPGVYAADIKGVPLVDQSEFKTVSKLVKARTASTSRDRSRQRLERAVIRLAASEPALRRELTPVLQFIHEDRAIRTRLSAVDGR